MSVYTIHTFASINIKNRKSMNAVYNYVNNSENINNIIYS